MRLTLDHKRKLRRRALAVGGAVIVAFAVSVVLISDAVDDDGDRLVPATDRAAATHPLLVKEGDRVAGHGHVVAIDGAARLCGPTRLQDGGTFPSPDPLACDVGLALPGFDVQQLAEVEGGRAGSASFSGTWTAGQLRVEAQSQPGSSLPSFSSDAVMDSSVVPCPVPADGWPDASTFPQEDYPAGLLAHRETHPDDVLSVAVLHPLESQSVLGVVAADDAAAERIRTALTSAYGAALCVIASDYTVEDLRRAGPQAAAELSELGVYAVGEPAFVTGLQLRVSWSALVIDEALQERLLDTPSGLVLVSPLVGPQPPK